MWFCWNKEEPSETIEIQKYKCVYSIRCIDKYTFGKERDGGGWMEMVWWCEQQFSTNFLHGNGNVKTFHHDEVQ